VSVAPTTNDSGTYYNLQVVNGARPSQLPGRTPVKIVIDDSADVVAHTVAAGKTLYITDLNIFIENTDTNNSGRVNLVNSTGATTPIVYPILVGESVNNATSSLVNSHTFTEPIEFGTGVFVDIVLGTIVLGGVLNGYEE
jgi:hypothetical protein